MNDNNFFSQAYDMQKGMFDMWQKSFGNVINAGKSDSNNNIFKDGQDAYNKLFSTWTDSFKQFQGMANMPGMTGSNFFGFNDQQELLKKMFSGASVYQSLFSFWKDLSEKTPYDTPEKTIEFCKEWQSKYLDIMKNTFAPILPEYMRSAFKQPLEVMEDFNAMGFNFFKPWLNNTDEFKELFEKGLKGDQGAYSEFLKLLSKNYEESYGKVFNASGVGLYKENIEQQMESYDSFIKYMISFQELMSIVSKVSTETMEDLVKQYQKMFEEGTVPKTFKEFYELWWKTNESAFISLFGTQEFSKLFGNFAEKYCQFKMKYDELLEAQLKLLPLPSKTDMNSLYKTVYDQKKELRDVKKQMKEMNAKLEELLKREQK